MTTPVTGGRAKLQWKPDWAMRWVALDWFNMLYQVLLGQEKGPRFGSFVAVYGVQNTIDMIDGALARSG